MNSLLLNIITGAKYTPNGSTEIPIDDYRIWIDCAGISDTYGSLAAVIADSTARTTLCNNLNALRYMVRSTSTIFPAVLADSAWVTALNGSTYAATTPTMTGATTPSGVASASTQYDATYAAWKAFDRNAGTYWASNAETNGWIQYQYAAANTLYAVSISTFGDTASVKNIDVRGSNNGSSWTNLKSIIVAKATGVQVFAVPQPNAYSYQQLDIIDNYGAANAGIYEIVFYGLNLE